jgi:hypothetical protein
MTVLPAASLRVAVAVQVDPDVTVAQPVTVNRAAVPALTLKPSEFEVMLSPIALKDPDPPTTPVNVTCATPFVKLVVAE